MPFPGCEEKPNTPHKKKRRKRRERELTRWAQEQSATGRVRMRVTKKTKIKMGRTKPVAAGKGTEFKHKIRKEGAPSRRGEKENGSRRGTTRVRLSSKTCRWGGVVGTKIGRTVSKKPRRKSPEAEDH